jgi:hypothetical protein
MSEATRAHREAVLTRVLDGDGVATPAARRAAFDAVTTDPRLAGLLAMVTQHAYKITDEDVAAARAAGVTDDELFELTAAAALGQATRQRAAAAAAIDAAFAGAKATEAKR